MIRSAITILCVFLFISLNGQVIINEYSCSNLNSFFDSFGRTEDWIELYNPETTGFDLSGWHLSDKSTKPTKWEIPVGTIIPANGHLVFYCSGRDGVFNDEYHTNFKLSQTKENEFVLLSNSDGLILESHPIPLTLVEHSVCRTEDGSPVWRICTEPTLGSSNNNSPQVHRYSAKPTIAQTAGFYADSVQVSIINNESNSILRYTIDGTNPTETSPEYAGPLNILSTTVVKAQAFSLDPLVLPGKMDFSTFFINENYSLAVFSVAADEVIDLANGNGQLIPIGSLEYFNTDKVREATSFGSLNRHGQDSWVLPHRSLDWVSRDEMGYSRAIQAPLFSYSDRDSYQKFMFRNSGDDNYPAIDDNAHEGSTHIRDEFVHTIAMESGMKLDQRAVERVIVFLNGQYWGVYGMRERPVDHDYTGEYYNQGKYDIQYLSTWGSTEIQYGGVQAFLDWKNLRDYILENDMSIEENYGMAADSLNMLSLIDYMLLNLNVVASDWLNYNTGWWRGLNPDGDHKKWGYIVWDLDATFDYYINYSGVPNISPEAKPCDLEQISNYMDVFFPDPDDLGNPIDNPEECPTVVSGASPYPVTDSIFLQTIAQDEFCCYNNWDQICQDLYDQLAAGTGNIQGQLNLNVGKHEKIFLKLLEESPTFRELYFQRYADLMNTTFNCENMISTLEKMIAVIEPEMPGQIARWGGTMTEWNANIDQLKSFINERCTRLDDGAIDCYDDISGPYQVTLLTQPEGIGEIDFNTLDIETFPWTGDYFGGTQNKIEANVWDPNEDEWDFSHWISTAGNQISPDSTSIEATILFEANDTLIAVFKEKTPSASVEIPGLQSFSAFPNPTLGQLRIEYSLEDPLSTELTLFTTLGKRVLDIPTSGRNQFSISLSTRDENLAAGIYFLVLSVEQGKKVIRINVLD
ncbi:MAG: T9SS type A sorting domain-containing protein [Saprospiraceae bacterium]|nr:T9SS type A sorting domain-containing protein [Saprospiraceae bacterium]